MPIVTIRVPDIGDFEDVEVIEILVAPDQSVAVEDSLITVESDKASMELPCPQSGVVREVLVAVGDRVSEGSEFLRLEVAQDRAAEPPAAAIASPQSARPPGDMHAEVVVLGAGPGGYTAAFRAADLGKQVVLVERYSTLGGVCLNVGCIPSKALLHVAEGVAIAEELREAGVDFGAPRFDLGRMRGFKDGVVKRLTDGLAQLAKTRNVEVVTGTGRLCASHLLEVERADGSALRIGFDHAILAAGSRVVRLPMLPDADPRIMDSTAALELADVPGELLVIGGGVIGLEMATVYDALGSRVTVVEMLDRLLAGVDPDIVRPLARRIATRYAAIHLGTKVVSVDARDDGLHVTFEGPKAPPPARFDRILVATGRRPNADSIGAELAGVEVDARGFVPVDAQRRTNVAHIFAIGDLAAEPMLAHKAIHEGRVAAEVIAGLPSAFDPGAVPGVAYTDPEVAWMGLTETEAKAQGVELEVGRFPWSASGRALGSGRSEGLTKLLFSKATGRLVGAGIVGRHAGELLAETVLALELGADAEDIGLTIHAHPTLAESIGIAAEVASGSATDLPPPRKRKP